MAVKIQFGPKYTGKWVHWSTYPKDIGWHFVLATPEDTITRPLLMLGRRTLVKMPHWEVLQDDYNAFDVLCWWDGPVAPDIEAVGKLCEQYDNNAIEPWSWGSWQNQYASAVSQAHMVYHTVPNVPVAMQGVTSAAQAAAKASLDMGKTIDGTKVLFFGMNDEKSKADYPADSFKIQNPVNLVTGKMYMVVAGSQIFVNGTNYTGGSVVSELELGSVLAGQLVDDGKIFELNNVPSDLWQAPKISYTKSGVVVGSDVQSKVLSGLIVEGYQPNSPLKFTPHTAHVLRMKKHWPSGTKVKNVHLMAIPEPYPGAEQHAAFRVSGHYMLPSALILNADMSPAVMGQWMAFNNVEF